LGLTLQEWADLGTVIGIPVAAIALFFNAKQTRNAALSARAGIWLELEKMFTVYDSVHRRLLPGGDWANGDPEAGPESVDEWASVDDYMGLFEHCEIMIQNHLLDWHTFDRIYSYRLSNIIDNEMIVRAKLIDEAPYWKDFQSLLRRWRRNSSPGHSINPLKWLTFNR